MATKENDVICEHCEPIKESDKRYNSMQEHVSKSGCALQNDLLTQCLSLSNQDFRKCMKETEDLKQCLMAMKLKQDSPSNS